MNRAGQRQNPDGTFPYIRPGESVPARPDSPIFDSQVNAHSEDVCAGSNSGQDLSNKINTIPKTRLSRAKSHDHDYVDEYIFSSDDDRPQEDDCDSDGAQSHISVSSGLLPEDDYALDQRPWLMMDHKSRHAFENMFISLTYPAIGESWLYTEEYQQQLDNIMLDYLQDFPTSRWAVGHAAAENAVNTMRERVRWRELGIRIYNAERLPELLRGRQTCHGMPPGAMPSPYGQMPNGHLQHQQVQHVHPQGITLQQSAPMRTQQPPQAVYQALPGPSRPHQAQLSSFDPSGTGLYASILLSHTKSSRTKKAHKASTAAKSKQDDDETDDDAEAKIKKHSHSLITREGARTPPYPRRQRPVASQVLVKQTKRQSKKAAEPDSLPWHRQLDFKEARLKAVWYDDYRDPQTTMEMHRVRLHNQPIIYQLDNDVTEKQRAARNAKKLRDAGQADGEAALRVGGRKKKDPTKSDGADLYHSGSFHFASSEDAIRAQALACTRPEELLQRGELRQLGLDLLRAIRICWGPGKKTSTHDLQQTSFTIAESVITRQRLVDTPVLTWTAAECIIDFCPDLLWRDILLRVCSESGMGNKDMRERFCLNGCYADKATFTKRISAALGQKQFQPRSKGYLPGEKEYYQGNSDDFDAYINFFGKRTTFRHIKAGAKRRWSSAGSSNASAEDNINVAGRPSGVDGQASVVKDVDDSEDDETDSDVSAQDSDELDMLSD